MIFSSGDLSSFTIKLERPSAGRSITLAENKDGDIVAKPMVRGRQVRAARGFTLIEVLVALAIVAIGMAAVLESLTSSANTTMYLQDKTFASWVALNRIETVRLSGSVPQAGTSNDNVSYAGQSWEWQQKVTTTQIPGMVQIEVDVKPADSTAGDDKRLVCQRDRASWATPLPRSTRSAAAAMVPETHRTVCRPASPASRRRAPVTSTPTQGLQ